MGKREEKKQRTRKHIRQTAKILFIEQGFQSTTIDDIVKSVGIARGTFYLYYEDKISLFTELLQDMYQPIVDILQRTLNDFESTNATVLSHQIRYLQTAIELAQFIEVNKSTLPLHFQEIWSAGEHGLAMRQWRSDIENLAQALIDSSIQQEIIRPVPSKMTAMAIVSAAERVIWGWQNGELESQRQELAQEMALLFWAGIAPQ